MEEGGLETILKEVKPKLIISALRGNFNSLLEVHEFLIDFVKNNNSRILFFPRLMYLMLFIIIPRMSMIKHFPKVFTAD